MLDMLKKPIVDIQNRRHQKILIRLQNYNFEGTHIARVNNKIADALSRLCRNIISTHHYPQTMPRILPTSKRASIREKQLEVLDPLVVELAEIGATTQSTPRCTRTWRTGSTPRTSTRRASLRSSRDACSTSE